MHRTLTDLIAVLVAAACFFPFFVPPGYLFAFATDLNGFRSRTLAEKLLWAVALSAPLSILLTVFSGRHFSTQTTTAVLLACLLLWLALIGWQAARGTLWRRGECDRPTKIAVVFACLLALYCVLATLGITAGHKLYEGAYAGDWSVRVPLTAAAIRSGVPITTPFDGIDGQSFPLRYYYYWYALCGAAGRIAHASARSTLAASSMWSAFSLLAVLFLLAKYLFPPLSREVTTDAARRVTLRWQCVLMLPVACILGLDLVPSVAMLFLHPPRLFPEMEWWRSEGDFSLSFHTAILYAPHHTAGLACCMLGFLVLAVCAQTQRGSNGAQPGTGKWKTVLLSALTVALCFAAALGTSTYLTVIFVLACALLSLERALVKDWRTVAAIALAGMIALPLASTYLHEILAGAGASIKSGQEHLGHARFLAVYPRNVRLPAVELIQLGRRFHHAGDTPFWLKALLRPPLTVLLYVVELGFFGFVLLWRMWADLRRPRALDTQQRMQWVLAAALLFAALLLTSQPVIGVNDLGRHAGLALRFVAVLWATPLLVRLRYDRAWPVMRHPWLRRCVYATIMLGLGAQMWQAVVQRCYFWLVDRGVVVYPAMPFPRFSHYGQRYYDEREANEAMDRVVPPTGRVQFNPASTTMTLASDYLERPVAAFDLDCQAAFGGDIDACHRAMPAIRGLFGGSHPIVGAAQGFDPLLVTPAAFASVCRTQHLDAVLVSASDRVWPEKQSWLWTRPAIFTNRSMRVVACDNAHPVQ